MLHVHYLRLDTSLEEGIRRKRGDREVTIFILYRSLLGAHYANARLWNYYIDGTVICIWHHATSLRHTRFHG